MKPSYALNLSTEGIGLLHRSGDGWRLMGEVALEDPDLAGKIEAMRRTADALESGGITTKLIIPNSQILYRQIDVAPDADPAQAVHDAMDGATPYTLDQLAIDWQPLGDGKLAIAAVARQTLREAETFAEDNRFNPVSFVACPDTPDDYPTEPFFGEARAAASLLDPGTRVERDDRPVFGPLRATERTRPHAEPVRMAEVPAPVVRESARDIPTGAEPSPDTGTGEPTNAPGHPSGASNDGAQPADAVAGDGARDAEFRDIERPVAARAAAPRTRPRTPRRLLSALEQAEAMPARSQVILGLILIAMAIVLWVTVVMRETVTSWFNAPDPAPVVAVASVPGKPGPALEQGAAQAPPPPSDATTEDGATETVRASSEPGPVAPVATAQTDVQPEPNAGTRQVAKRLVRATGPVESLTGRQASGTVFMTPPQGPLAATATALALSEARPDVAALQGTTVRRTAETPAEAIASAETTPDASAIAPRARARFLAAAAEPRVRPELLPATGGPPAHFDRVALRSLPEAELVAHPVATAIPAQIGDARPLPAKAAAKRITGTEVPPERVAEETISIAPGDILVRRGTNGQDETPQGARRLAALMPRGAAGSSEAAQDIPAETGLPTAGETTEATGEPTPATGPEADTGPDIAALRPPLVPGRTALLDIPEDQLIADIRPPLRPEPPAVEAEAVASAMAAALGDDPEAEADAQTELENDVAALRPRQRPSSVGRHDVASASGGNVAPAIPTSASVARQATQEAALQIQRVTLLGTTGTPSNRSALVKVGSKIERVKVGDTLDGGKVTLIGATSVTYVKLGRNHVLQLPRG